MKKQYVTLWLSVTTFDSTDVVTASITDKTKTFGYAVDATETWWGSSETLVD